MEKPVPLVVSCWIVLLLCMLCSVNSDEICNTCRMNSRTDELTCDLNHDSDPQTFSETGYHIGSWVRCSLTQEYNVTGVQLQGESAALQVRVGHGDPLGMQGGFAYQEICKEELSGLKKGTPLTLNCTRPVKGTDVFVKIVDNDMYARILLTEMKVITQ